MQKNLVTFFVISFSSILFGNEAMYDFETSLGYRVEEGTSFRSELATSRILELDLRPHVRLGSWPLALGYYFKMPIADAGSDKIGVKKGFFFRNGIDLQTWYDSPVLPFIPYASFGYTFYGYTEISARSTVKGQKGDDSFELPAGNIEMSYTMKGTALDLGGRIRMNSGSQLYFGISYTNEKRQLASFTFNRTDQKSLLEDAINNSKSFSRKVLVGMHWDF